MQNIKEILSGINIPFPAQKVYVSLLEDGKATARTLSHRTGITRTSIYDQLKVLLSKGLIIERDIEGAAIFEVGDVRQLSILLDDQVGKLSSQQEYLAKNMNSLVNKSQSVQPKIRFFEGKDGAKQLLKDILWHDDITLYLYWPYVHMLDFLGSDFLLWFDERRKVRDIPLRTIWGHRGEKIKKHIFSEDGPDVERRYLTQKNIPSMGYIIYDKKVAFISSRKESFGFIVESAEFASLQKMQFDILWNAAKKK
jgi:HTH-type transcriptional regulator, sugar sensing transcriptional regulator